MTSAEIETAYFTLLRAREELADLRRYREYLTAEAQRLRRTSREAEALRGQVNARQRRRLQHTDQPLAQAVADRLAAIDDEAARLPTRITAAEAFVEECEREHIELKAGR